MPVGDKAIPEALLPLCKQLAEQRLERNLRPEQAEAERKTIAEIDAHLKEERGHSK